MKKLKTIAFTLAAFGFLFSASLTSCGNKSGVRIEADDTEIPAAQEGEHPEGEHPADTTGGEHPAGGEHPDN
jgi:hypothetical protein